MKASTPARLRAHCAGLVSRAALCLVALLAVGCASGPRPLDVAVPGDAEGADEVLVLEYSRSAAGEPVPAWVGADVAELEAAPEFEGSYLFLFPFAGESLEDVQSAMGRFAEGSAVAGALLERALPRTEGIRGLSDEFVNRAVRIVAAVEYAGLKREGEFWVHEQLIAEKTARDRYRGWLLYRVPRDQVHAGLRFAYENASASFPPATEPDLRAREQLAERFRDGL